MLENCCPIGLTTICAREPISWSINNATVCPLLALIINTGNEYIIPLKRGIGWLPTNSDK